MTTLKERPIDPNPAGELERRKTARGRRDDNKRRSVEMLLDRVFRPARWAARLTYAMRLQGGPAVHVDRQEISSARASATPLRIAFASDFHAGSTTDARLLTAAVQQIEALEPDVVLLGGDFVSVRSADIHPLAELLAKVHAPLGKFGVFGNHDKRANLTVVRQALERAGVRILVNEVARLSAPHGDVSIIGFDDPIIGEPDGALLDDVEGVRIVLMHAPDGMLAIGERRFDLAVAGHTHGGQVRIPGAPIPYLPHGALSRTYPAGAYHLGDAGDQTLVVSRGVGCSTIPIRLACAPEVHLVVISSD